MGEFFYSYDITDLKGADYNPRFISDEQLSILKDSITALGIVKPLIVRNNTLVAGHQRTKALKSLGVFRCPAYVLSVETTEYDEMRFNQLHNGTDLDSGAENAFIGCSLNSGFNTIDPKHVSADFRSPLAAVRGEIAKLIIKYGAWGSCVATTEGRIIHAAQYAMAAKLTNTPLLVYAIDESASKLYGDFLNRQYGQFDYTNLPKKTYVQTYAQMNRLRGGGESKASTDNKSTLYENFVLPYLKKNPSVVGLDFGSGKGDYAKAVRNSGRVLYDLEFFRRTPGADVIDTASVKRMCSQIHSYVEKHGLFDFVVCDSVLNSVDSVESEESVAIVCNFFLKPGGQLFISGRANSHVEYGMNSTKASGKLRKIECLDKNGFTALFRKGAWFYQKFHSKEQIAYLLSKSGFHDIQICYGRIRSSSFQVVCKKNT